MKTGYLHGPQTMERYELVLAASLAWVAKSTTTMTRMIKKALNIAETGGAHECQLYRQPTIGVIVLFNSVCCILHCPKKTFFEIQGLFFSFDAADVNYCDRNVGKKKSFGPNIGQKVRVQVKLVTFAM